MATLPADEGTAKRIESVESLTRATGPGATLMSASTLTGNNVVNLAGETLARSRKSCSTSSTAPSPMR